MLSDILVPQGSALFKGINAFEPFIYRLHKEYKDGEFTDWPTVVLTTTAQSTAVSLFKLLPSQELSNEVLDKRSIATLIRNIVDTFDVMDMMINTDTQARFDLHRNILGMYLSGRINKVQSFINIEKAEEFYKGSKQYYWSSIKKSPLFNKSMEKLKSSESVFYQSRAMRVKRACGEHADFVSGVLADLSTHVHSIPPSIWMSSLDELFSDTTDNRNMTAVWLRIANFYFAKIINIVITKTNYELTPELKDFIEHHKEVFS